MTRRSPIHSTLKIALAHYISPTHSITSGKFLNLLDLPSIHLPVILGHNASLQREADRASTSLFVLDIRRGNGFVKFEIEEGIASAPLLNKFLEPV